ncbi:MAG: glycosyltransferase family 2 protein [Armatimonadetes bacterium]|nr:glycosyltransferase family 2 protein [Armatimonadota bacterium]
MDLSIAIVSWNTRDLLNDCLASIPGAAGGLEYEVIVVDNASSDGSPKMVSEAHPGAKLIANDANAGFARANNQAYEASGGRNFLLLNPDTVCHAGSLSTLVRFLDENPKAGAVGPMVLNEDGTLQYSWAGFPTIASELVGKLDRRIDSPPCRPSMASEVRDLGPFAVGWIGGCCMMVRRAAIEQVGLLDESLFMYSEEMDWCLRLQRAGWEVWVQPEAEIVHLGGRSSDQAPRETSEYLRRSKAAYFQKHSGRAAGVLVRAILGAKAGLRCFGCMQPKQGAQDQRKAK